jgi:hypothetical protein
MTVYFGDALASRALEIARIEDRASHGMTISELLAAITRHGEVVRGDNPASVLRSALNRNQHIWEHPARGLWAWRSEAAFDPSVGLSGAELADAAYSVAVRLDPGRRGIHYEAIAADLKRTGIAVRGPQPGSTLSRALASSGRFARSPEEIGVWVWR